MEIFTGNGKIIFEWLLGVRGSKMEKTSFVGNTNKFPVETHFLNRDQTIIKGSTGS
jgi:hypothetical protein